MLTQTLYGQENVGAYQKLIAGIQGAPTDLPRFTSAGRLVEYWIVSSTATFSKGSTSSRWTTVEGSPTRPSG